MFDRSDNTTVRRPRRVEVITGPEHRREWPEAEKVAIVAESLAPGANVSEVARRHDLSSQQLFGWRKRFRAVAEATITPAPIFTPVLIEAAPSAPSPPPAEPASIEITIGTATVRIRGAADAKTLAAVLKALRVRARTPASPACGSMSFNFAVTNRLYMAAARSPPRSSRGRTVQPAPT